MKKLQFYKWLPLVAICVFFLECQYVNTADWDSEERGILNIETRSAATEDILYPLFLYAFSESGDCVGSQTVYTEDDKISMSLPSGRYRIIALAGSSDDYKIPVVTHWDDRVELMSDVIPETPLMRGVADVVIDSEMENTLEIVLSYSVTALDISFANIPPEVVDVMVTISSFYSSMNLKGEYADPNYSLNLKCILGTDNKWTASQRFVFPGSSDETVFSITLKMEDGSKTTYGYVWKDSPKANQPYHLKGDYLGHFVVNGTFVIAGWEEIEDVEFEFGMIGEPDDDVIAPGVDLSELPEIGSIWNDCLVVDVGEADASGVDVLLMSLDEWDATTSQVGDVVSGYSVNGMSDWRLPTDVEASLLRTCFSGNNRLALNELIAEYDTSLYGLSAGEDERYLCLKSGEFYTFRFVAGTKTTKAGDVRSYYVRLVKTYHMVL